MGKKRVTSNKNEEIGREIEFLRMQHDLHQAQMCWDREQQEKRDAVQHIERDTTFMDIVSWHIKFRATSGKKECGCKACCSWRDEDMSLREPARTNVRVTNRLIGEFHSWLLHRAKNRTAADKCLINAVKRAHAEYNKEVSG